MEADAGLCLELERMVGTHACRKVRVKVVGYSRLEIQAHVLALSEAVFQTGNGSGGELYTLDAGVAGLRMESLAGRRRFASLALGKRGRRNGDRPGRIRCKYFQARAGLHQHPNDLAEPS